MKVKYIILDFGKVIAGPVTGNWYISPKISNVIDKSKYDKYLKLFKENRYLLNGKIETTEQEYDAFYKFYKNVLNLADVTTKELVYNFVYEIDKFKFYENVETELQKLSEKYILLMLTDNWPSVINVLKQKSLYKYFDKVYVSSVYGTEKKDKVFFDYLISDYNIKDGEAIFIDDNEALLDIALDKGLKTLQMVRENDVIKSKHKIIHNLLDI